LIQSGKAACVQCWIYLTFLRLSRAGDQLELCHQLPEEGVVVALTGNLPRDFKCPKGIFLIGVVADGNPHPACHFHILQNAKHAARLPRSTYIPLWPQPGLIPRKRERGDRFENIYFFGDPPNLAPELRDPSFSDSLREQLGLNLVIAGSDRWHDYSEADCVIAIRELGARGFLGKPATKLYNAWMAGVPFIGGGDSAFETDGRPGVDYLRCTTLESVITALDLLKNDSNLRCRMVDEGLSASLWFSPSAITERWIVFLYGITRNEVLLNRSKHRAHKWVDSLAQHLNLTFDKLRGDY
jgi:hypothetical protein